MSFRSEVREFITEQKAKDSTIKILLGEMADLRKQNNSLMDRLMAKDFQELKVFEPEVYSIQEAEIEPEDDYQNAGEIV